MYQSFFGVSLLSSMGYFSQLWAETDPTRPLTLGGSWHSCCFPSCFQHPTNDSAGQGGRKHTHSVNWKSGICKMKQSILISKLLSTVQAS